MFKIVKNTENPLTSFFSNLQYDTEKNAKQRAKNGLYRR